MKPVAWYRDEDGIRMYYDAPHFDDAKPLYSAQREWVGLTNAEIAELKILPGANRERTATEMAFAIEAKLKEKNI